MGSFFMRWSLDVGYTETLGLQRRGYLKLFDEIIS